MNYSDINPYVNYNKSLPSNEIIDFNGSGQFEETPNFSKYQQLYGQNHKFSENYCGGGSTLAIGGLQMENTKVSLVFFSDDNIKRIQKEIKNKVFELSKGKFKLEVDQDHDDLLIAMRYIYIEHSRNLPTHIVKQVKILNKELLNYIIPDIITNIKQTYSYLKEISSPINPHNHPINVNNKGRKTLPSIDTLWR